MNNLIELESIKDYHSLIPRDPLAITSQLRSRSIPLYWLIATRFGPYYPSVLENKSPSEFCRVGIEDMKRLILENVDELRNVGLLSAGIVGSASAGLTQSFPYGVIKERQANGYLLTRAPNTKCDIDTNCHVEDGKLDECVNLMTELAYRYRKMGKFLSPPGTLSFYLIPFQYTVDTILNAQKSYAFVTYTLWQNTRIPIVKDWTYMELQKIAMDRIRTDPVVEDFFWQNLTDRYWFSQCKIKIKQGLFDRIFLSAEDVPTMFDPQVRSIKSRAPNGYYEF